MGLADWKQHTKGGSCLHIEESVQGLQREKRLVMGGVMTIGGRDTKQLPRDWGLEGQVFGWKEGRWRPKSGVPGMEMVEGLRSRA